VNATNLTVTGNSKIAGFNISGSSLIADEQSNGSGIAGIRSMRQDQQEIFSLGRAYSAASGWYNTMAILKDSRSGVGTATGLSIDVSNKTVSNIAIDIVSGMI